MAIIYKIEFVSGGFAESPDLQAMKDAQANQPGTITAFDEKYRVNNDPVDTEYEDFASAEARMQDLQALYFIDPQRTLIAPQPNGLND